MRIFGILGVCLVAVIWVAEPAWADFDSLAAKIADIHAVGERARSAAHDALAEKHRAEQTAIDRRCAKMGGARIGLNAEGVLKSCWGRPEHINSTTTASGTHEQWVYSGGYLYFDNGIVTGIQTSR